MLRSNGKYIRKLMVVVPVLLAATIIAGCSSVSAGTSESNASPTSKGLIQSSTGGSVTIDVKWLGVEDNSLAFDVSMNTHSVNLDQYDLKQLAILKDDLGNEYVPLRWDSSPGGHHRSGKLVFALTDSLDQPESKELVIRNVAGITERVFTWNAATISGAK